MQRCDCVIIIVICSDLNCEMCASFIQSATAIRITMRYRLTALNVMKETFIASFTVLFQCSTEVIKEDH
jgi:hypothetical protein